MFSLRYFINVCDSPVMDSYHDESMSVDAHSLDANINLEVAGFAQEDEQLARQYVIEDPLAIQAVREYTGGSDINEQLLQAGNPLYLPPIYQQQYVMLMGLRHKVALGELHHVYSGTGAFNPMDIVEDGFFHTPAFLSTSLSVKVAVKTTNYRREEAYGQDDHVLHLVLPPGFTNGWYVARYSVDPEELEMLIFPQVRFRHVRSQTMPLGGIERTVHTFRAL